jgi:hypothetical protein
LQLRGAQLMFPGHYGLKPAGHPHSAFIGREMIILAVYIDEPEPEDARDFDVIDLLPSGAKL